MSEGLLSRAPALDGASLPADDAFRVAAQPACARFALRGGEGVASAVCSALGVDAPERINRASGDPSRAAVLRLGPDEWLAMAAEADAAALAARLSRAIGSAAHSLVDVSHRQTGLTLTGRLARRVLSAGCPLDLREATFPTGMATRTIFLKCEIILWRLGAEAFHVEAWRSFAPYLLGHFVEARRGAADL